MADIRTKDFWINLLKKVLKNILRDAGVNTSQKSDVQHVVPYKDGWAVRGEGNTRITSDHRKQSTAIRKAKQIAKRRKSDVVIHRADGTIRDRISFDQ